MHNHCFQFLLGNMGIIAVPRENEDNGYATSFFGGLGAGGGGVKSKQGALWPMEKWWTQYFAVFASTVWGLSALKKIYIYTFVIVEMTAANINVLHQP